MKRILPLLLLLLGLSAVPAFAAPARLRPEEFRMATDSIARMYSRKTTVENRLTLKKVVKTDQGRLDFYFDQSLGDYPWREKDVEWLRSQLKKLLPTAYASCEIGEIRSKETRIEDLVTPPPGVKGWPQPYAYTYDDRNLRRLFVEREGTARYAKGLSGRNIALWQSHGRYFDDGSGQWKWQRAPLHRTVEDMYTQSYVLPYLIPMLERAGAYVMTPRERDTQRYEVIIDNDPTFPGERVLPLRQTGIYNETGKWESSGAGFADTAAVYLLDQNPFRAGTTRRTFCAQEADAEAVWSFRAPARDNYAVYVSYRTEPNSSTCAHYTVRHRGGQTGFVVNQRMGGGTWIYLGTFEFEGEGAVVLDNGTPEGRDYARGTVVSADAVKIGGGMGKIARGSRDADPSEYRTSGLPSFAEGALYSMQWAGVDSTVTAQWDGEYTRDYASRGAWVSQLCGGSVRNPEQPGKGVPIDLSFAFHSDAGVTPNDSTVGTLAIYSLLCEGKDELPDGKSRAVGRHYAELVQTQVVEDIRARFDPLWRRRRIWDRSYSESRTTSVPGMLLEGLSHQNFADMRYGLDPDFRFTVSRAVYKGMLKFLSDLYKRSYVVQPLPVRSLAVTFSPERDHARISWQPVSDPAEPTAEPKSYILYTRMDDGSFDEGEVIRRAHEDGDRLYHDVPIRPGHLYSFKVEAVNDGGRSFPSEILSIGSPTFPVKGKVVIVNNFDRVGAPTWFDTPSYAGFEGSIDAGVPYLYDISYIGENYMHRRTQAFETNDSPGFGASRSDKAGSIIAGNSFDYPSVHGRALLEAGYAVFSLSRDAWTARSELSADALAADLICGKQVTTPRGTGPMPARFQVYPEALQRTLTRFTSTGGHLIVSGADIATDLWDQVYPVPADPVYQTSARSFAENILGYGFQSGFGCYDGAVAPVRNKTLDLRARIDTLHYWNEFNKQVYRVEHADALRAPGKLSTVFLQYPETGMNAAIAYNPGNYKVISFGFPLETLKDPAQIRILLESAMAYFTGQ
ncbi:MAG: xanthan lyase [Bacteroidales bacterium]|nr:xanthan lyase [Bacteroidales bacterium]